MKSAKGQIQKYSLWERTVREFIKGDEPIANWDKYVKSVTDMGYQAIVDLYNAKAAELEK